jgi:hypothetical protein
MRICFKTVSALLLLSSLAFQGCQESRQEDLQSDEQVLETAIKSEEAKSKYSSIWDGSGPGFCRLTYSVLDKNEAFKSLKKNTISTDKLQKLAKSYRASLRWQEAIWLYEDLGDPDSLYEADRLKADLRRVLSSSQYVVLKSKASGGTVAKTILQFSNGIEAIFKEDTKSTGQYWGDAEAEAATYELDQLVNARVVPMTILKTVKGLDYLTGNMDRKVANFLYLPELDRLVAIDNGLGLKSLSTVKELAGPKVFIPKDFARCGVARNIVKFLKNAPALKERIMTITDGEILSQLRDFHDPNAARMVAGKIKRLRKLLENDSVLSAQVH